jgi:phosphate transport system substrate-binding protein
VTDTNTSDQRFGRCINAGYCSLADKRTPIPLKPGDPLDCPECGKPIIVIPPTGKSPDLLKKKLKPPPRRLILLGSIIATLVAFGVYYNMFRPLPEEVEQEDEAAQAGEYIPPAQKGGGEGGPGAETRVTVNLFTLGATPETREKLAPALAAAFMRSRGCTAVSQQLTKTGELLLSCNYKDKRLLITIAATSAASAFEYRAGRPIDVLLTATPQAAGKPRNTTVIGFDPVAVIVHPASTLRRLSVPQLAAIFSGSTGDFGAVGGTPGSISLIAGRENSSGVVAFSTLVLDGKPLPASARRFADDAAVSAAVGSDPRAIGLVIPDRIGNAKALGIGPAGGLAPGPSIEAISGGSYPLSRRISIEIPRGSQIRNAAPFAEFAATRAGQAAVKLAGFMPLAPEAARPDPGAAPTAYPPFLTGATKLPMVFHFQPGTSALDPASTTLVTRAVAEIARRKTPPDRVVVLGFTDPVPEAQGLSLRFAERVAKAMTDKGLTPGTVRGLGDTVPIADNATPEGQAQNRRVEIWIRP